jgi:medium-chain acyl-[acyl-carrier-protein] hydrolase
VRLFCLPFSGGNPVEFRPWVEALPDTVEVCAVNLPGRGNRWSEAPYTRMPVLVKDLVPAMTPLLNKPFALYGHSLGALLAFETARELRRGMWPGPAHLFVAGCDAPHALQQSEPVHALADAEFVEWLQHQNGTPKEVLRNREIMRLMLPVLRADFEVWETYAYTDAPPLACPITAFGGEQDPITRPEGLDAWQSHTTRRFAWRMFPGDHFFPRVRRTELLEEIGRILSELMGHKL